MPLAGHGLRPALLRRRAGRPQLKRDPLDGGNVRVLFLCGQNRIRSPTAERVFDGRPGLEVESAGLNHDAQVAVTPEMIAKAEVIFVMEKRHLNKLSKRFRAQLRSKRVICLNIPDEFEYMQPELISLLETRVTPRLRSGA